LLEDDIYRFDAYDVIDGSFLEEALFIVRNCGKLMM